MVTIPIGMLAWGRLNTLLSESSRLGGPALPIRNIWGQSKNHSFALGPQLFREDLFANKIDN